MIATPALPTFDLAIRGYDRRQVDEYLDRLEHDLSVAHADRDAASARIAATEKRLSELEEELLTTRELLTENSEPTYAGLGKRVEQLLSIAEEEAARLRADAGRDVADERAAAGTLIQQAEEHADQAAREFEAELESRRREAAEQEAAARAELDKRLAIAEKAVLDAEEAAKARLAEAATNAEQLITDATSRSDRVRKEAEQHATSVVQAARHDVEKIELEARSQAETILTEARTTAEQRRNEHDREIAELVSRRQEIRGQLKSLRQVLGTLPDADDDEPAGSDSPPVEVAAPANGQAAVRPSPSPKPVDLRKTGS